MAKVQKCSIPGCKEDSIPGLVKGHGKCQYHWNLGVWGKKWADRCREKDIQAKQAQDVRQ